MEVCYTIFMNYDIRIRQAQPGDEMVVENLLTTKVHELAAKDIVQWELEEVTWDALSKDYDITNFHIVYRDNKPVATFSVVDYDPTYWLHDKPKEALYIHKVMVLDEASKSGISTMMLDYFKELGRKQGYDVVKLDVREYKKPLRAYYERNGFILVEIVDLGKGYLTALYEYKL